MRILYGPVRGRFDRWGVIERVIQRTFAQQQSVREALYEGREEATTSSRPIPRPSPPLRMTAAATPAPFLTFHSIEGAVREEIERTARQKKLHLCTLPHLSEMLGGLRPHELTIFTGPTGCGKTTVLSQISLDYCSQGVPIMWGSFETRTARLAEIMLQQMAQRPLFGSDGLLDGPVYERVAGSLCRMPMHFFNLFGSTSLETVMEAMRICMKTSGPQPFLFILDNLQFMLSGQAGHALDRWDLMDRTIAELRAFCTAHPVHVVLVIHPRKELDDSWLGLASISGTAKATQEADNVIILQKVEDCRYLDLRKNRYNGQIGRVRIQFMPQSRLVAEMIPAEEGKENEASDMKSEEVTRSPMEKEETNS